MINHRGTTQLISLDRYKKIVKTTKNKCLLAYIHINDDCIYFKNMCEIHFYQYPLIIFRTTTVTNDERFADSFEYKQCHCEAPVKRPTCLRFTIIFNLSSVINFFTAIITFYFYNFFAGNIFTNLSGFFVFVFESHGTDFYWENQWQLSHFSLFQAHGGMVLHGIIGYIERIFQKTITSLQNYRKWSKLLLFKFVGLPLNEELFFVKFFFFFFHFGSTVMEPHLLK